MKEKTQSAGLCTAEEGYLKFSGVTSEVHPLLKFDEIRGVPTPTEALP